MGERTVRNYLATLLEENLIVAVGQTNRRYYQRNYAIDEYPIVLAVLQNSKQVGTLSFSYAKGYVFSYSTNYRGERFPMLEEMVNYGYALLPFFENLIPESRRRERLLLKDGAILDKNSYVNLLEYRVDIAKEVLKAKSQSRELYSSLSGYQHKIDVNLDMKEKRVYRVNKESGELAHYLLKPYASDRRIKHTPYLALNEHLFMTFAKNELKLDVPFTAVLVGENHDFYFLTKRYNRYRGYKYNQYDFRLSSSFK